MFGKIYEEIDGNLLKEFKSWDSKSKENYFFILISLTTFLIIQGVITKTSVFIKKVFILSDDFSFLLTLLLYLIVYTFIFMFIRVIIMGFKYKKSIRKREKIIDGYKGYYNELYHHLNDEEKEILKTLYENKSNQEIIMYRIDNTTFQVYNSLLTASKEDVVMLRNFLNKENYSYSLNKDRYEEVIQSKFRGEKRSLKTLEEKLDFIEELWVKYDLEKFTENS